MPRISDETSLRNVSEKIDMDDLRENGHREGVKLIVGDYLKSFEMFDFTKCSKLHYSRSNCTLNNLQRKRGNSRPKKQKKAPTERKSVKVMLVT